ncbi:NnrS family protein [Roseospirillum parvum]|uniref:Uncharacterized protein involved in response to NO n=1 Tax=Roseospirillum parvum TaxID=83401 RepID=A0A1G7WPN6_9PROT|nr:NnrS family protein [Roseospirillum parvum]SDG73889.1 uncharacterized protein involved in response to NO [Roseospirillum parvum]
MPFSRFLDRGFRPFFLLAGVHAVVAMAAWLLFLRGHLALPGPMDPISWHAHEMLFGFAGAAVAGFALTAVANWTGRPPLSGKPLLLLVLAWAAGRLGGAIPVPWELAAAVDVVLPLALAGLVGREVAAAGNWRNLPVVVGIGLLGLASAIDWLEAAGPLADDDLGSRLGVAALVGLTCLIGGRMVPAFTRNWLNRRQATRLPAPPDRLDAATLGLTTLALAAWTGLAVGPVVALLLAGAGLLNLLRLARWRGLATLSEPLLWSLHLGYLWLGVGLLLLAGAAGRPDVVPEVPALHGLTAGAVGLTVVAVMSRATLGHSGRPLVAGTDTAVVFALLVVAAISRVWAGFTSDFYLPLLLVSGGAWIAAFLLYLWRYGPIQLALGERPPPA